MQSLVATRHNCAWLIFIFALTLADPSVADQEAEAEWQKGYIEGLLAGRAFFPPGAIAVDVDGTTVELTGEVGSRKARALAEQLAASTKGIRAVANKIRVVRPAKTGSEEVSSAAGEHRLSNVTINNKVMSRLLAHTETRGLDVEVRTSNRKVTVSGLVKSPLEKELIYWLIKNTEGVVHVVDNLQLPEDLPQQAGI